MQQRGFCRQQQKQFIRDSIVVPPDVGDLVLGLYPGLHFGFSHPHSQHMPPGNVLQTCNSPLKGRPVSPSVTHHCIHQERDSFPQHMVVFCRYFGPAEESVELVQSSHLVKEERGVISRYLAWKPDHSRIVWGRKNPFIQSSHIELPYSISSTCIKHWCIQDPFGSFAWPMGRWEVGSIGLLV